MLIALCPQRRPESERSTKGSRQSRSASVVDKVTLYRLFIDVLRIPPYVSKPIIETFYLWLRHYGPEWTTNRLKGLKVLYLQHYAGNNSFRAEEPGLSFHKDGSPRGAFHALWTIGNSYRMADKCLTVLMMYSSIILKGPPTRTQRRKFLEAVQNPRPAGQLDSWFITRDLGRDLYTSCWERAKYDTASSWITSEKKVLSLSPHIGFVRRFECGLPLDQHVADFLKLAHTLLDRTEIKKLFYLLFGYDAFLTYRSTLGNSKETLSTKAAMDLARSEGKTVGHIGLIQERGCKLRAVANPLRVIQIALSRLKNMLEMAAQSLPWDCTFDQEKGIRWAQEKLQSGETLLAFDLSNASDTIPLRDQIDLLSYVGHEIDDWEFWASLKLFYLVSRSKWVTFNGLTRNDFLQWSKGQGLGIGCSFGAFAQAHGHRLNLLQQRFGFANEFVVLGDDVIVTSKISHAYQSMVTSGWGCDISATKTITSAVLTEFASRVVTRNYKFKTYKFPKTIKLFDPRDPLGLFVRYGSKALKIVPSRYRSTVQLISSLPKTYGGLGWKWPESCRLLPDPQGLENILVPNKREQVPNFLTVKRLRRKGKGHKRGARFDSFEIYTKSHVERKQDLLVAFQSSQTLSIEIGHRKSKDDVQLRLESMPSMLTYIGKPTSELPITDLSDQDFYFSLQEKILHINANRDNDSEEFQAFIDEVLGSLNTRLSGRNLLNNSVTGASLLSQEHDPVSLFEKKIEIWIRATLQWVLFVQPIAAKFGIFLVPDIRLLKAQVTALKDATINM